MKKKKDSLLFKFAIIFTIFTTIVLATCGITTYFMQMGIFKQHVQAGAQNVAKYLQLMMKAEGRDFAEYQQYMIENSPYINIPYDYDGNYLPAKQEFEKLFAKEYPGKVFGIDVKLDEMPIELQDMYAAYCQEYWIFAFDMARDTFGMTYAYYMAPGDNYFTYYVVDSIREERIVDGEKYIELCMYADENIENHPMLWEALSTGKTPDGYDYFDNEYGRTYAYYSPLVIDGEILGVVAVEVEISKISKIILKNTLLQILGIACILILSVLLLLLFIDKKYIKKLEDLVNNVKLYTEEKDPQIAEEIENSGGSGDEIASLANQTAAMILELDDYMKNLVKTTKELSETKQHANELQVLVNRDALTGIRNKTGYDEEVEKLERYIKNGGKDFGIGMIDLNFLKKINDRYGHDKGNMAIRKVSKLTCNVFKHSPVFRIGGDEFVVVLKKNDYRDRTRLEKQFNDEIAKLSSDTSLEPWEAISAALGIAVFDPKKDKSVEDVFKKADAAMYKNKQKMEAIRE